MKINEASAIFGNAIKCFTRADGESGHNRHLSCEISGWQAGWDMPMLKGQHVFSKDLLTNDRRKFNISSVVPVARVCLGRGVVIRGLRSILGTV